ncbi:S41 family peptidase, partial [Idiomarina sp.]|uniref:S41 family peptidase n=1 Tax=Idiomarina sp. TaxID=1874361 RepID=UPI0025890B3D
IERPFTRDNLREALTLILKLADTGHTFYKSAVEPKFVMQRKFECVATNTYDLPIIPGHIVYIRVNSFNAPSEKAKLRYIKELRDEINRQKDRNTKAWIIDLRYNQGGNMWPMLAGVAPLLSNGVHGYFVKPDGSKTAWGTYDGQSFLNNQFMIGIEKPPVGDANMPIAVLSSEQTASSGESLLVAFEGKPNIRSFGKPSCGMSTANHQFNLSNGATLNITTAIMASSTGKVFGGRISVDEDSKRPVEDAIQWINKIVE